MNIIIPEQIYLSVFYRLLVLALRDFLKRKHLELSSYV